MQEMVDMFLMMNQEEDSVDEEMNKVAMEEVIKKAQEMFISLDEDGDGELTQVSEI